MKEVHLKLWQVSHREIIDLLDLMQHEADWICLSDGASMGEHVWLLSGEQLQACGCRNCELHAHLRFWVDSRRKAEDELQKLGCDGPRSKQWKFGPQA
jgi:hypothetical protein